MSKTLYRAGRQGVTLVETMVGMGTSCLVLFTVISVTANLSTQTDRDITRIPINSAARASMDDMLYYLRGARTVHAASTTTKITVSAPSYNPGAAGVTTGADDTMTFEFDSTNQTLLETITPAGGTVRKALSQHILAKNVQSVAFSYYGRQAFPLATYSYSGARSQTFTLDNAWKTGTTPTVAVMVNGVSYTVPSPTMTVTVGAATRTVTVGNVPAGTGTATVRYELAPVSGTLSAVAQVDVLLKFLQKDRQRVDQVFTIPGSARLRNSPPT